VSKAPPWETLLARKSNGRIEPCLANVATIFSHDPRWRNVLAFDEFIGDIVSLREPPWPIDIAPDKVLVGPWTESDTRLATAWLTREYNIAPRTALTGEGLHIAAARTSRHPLRDWLTSLKWDRKPRADSFLVRLAGADDNEYVRAVGKNFLLGAVARVLHPGEKVDSMPILEGAQGLGKSTLVRELAGEEFYLESTVEIGQKEGYQVLRKKWIVELGELDSLTKAEVSRVKQFLSQRVDTYRPSYGHTVQDFLRQCVFIGTVNPHGGGYLKDVTGARRFWPVYLRRIALKALRAEREQLWAEAVLRYRRCEAWHLDTPELLALARQEAEERRERDSWEEEIGAWLASLGAPATARGVTTGMLLDKVSLELSRRTRGDEMRAATVLRACGWTEIVRDWRTPGHPRYYRRPDWQDVVDDKNRRRAAKVIDMQSARDGARDGVRGDV
jgi:putative DNA primase/helicase